jgi:hypothetical protein
MHIKIRKVCGKYVAIEIIIDNVTYDLGLHDKDEAEQIAGILLAGSLEIQQAADDISSAKV